MPRRNGKSKFWKIMLEDELIDDDEFRFLLWYDREVKEELEKEVK